ncbi:MAG: 50S ribosomal protein L4 [Clostridia bacterium]|nr:50S ribosomal protein L4 [Clostridia bacterium]
MPEIKVVNMSGAEVGKITLADSVYGVGINSAVLHAAVKNYLGNQRQGTQSTLTRTEVSGGGKKPWRQKGSGRARQGSTRSPQWTHGGVALGPKPRSYRTKLNKKVRRLAICSALSSKVAADEMIVVDSIAATEYKTKVMADMLKAIGAGKKSLVVLPEKDEKAIASLSNIEGVKVALYNTINVYDILNCNTLVIAQDAAKKIEEVYAE